MFFLSVIQQYFFSDAGGAVAIFRDIRINVGIE